MAHGTFTIEVTATLGVPKFVSDSGVTGVQRPDCSECMGAASDAALADSAKDNLAQQHRRMMQGGTGCHSLIVLVRGGVVISCRRRVCTQHGQVLNRSPRKTHSHLPLFFHHTPPPPSESTSKL